MASSIEQILDDMERFIDEEGKAAPFSSSKIVINRDELENYIEELKATTPEEIRRYQKIISNREAILADARAKADQIISNAQIKTDELVSEHQIMQQAYAQANQVVMIATKDAQDMLDKATIEANDIKTGAMAYTDDLLSNIEEVLANSIELTRMRDESFIGKLSGILDRVVSNRNELRPQDDLIAIMPENLEPDNETVDNSSSIDAETIDSGTPSINVPEEFFKHD
ncbi:MAG: ATPase [Lachnospiraceae bacterium]|mgnify:CR=1 FL=1|jgi:cell division septum initiation protein DivIVA|nr:ATPase [Lachnospiraceae bacterium]